MKKLRGIMILLALSAIIWNMFLVPIATMCGVMLPVIVIDDNVRMILMATLGL